MTLLINNYEDYIIMIEYIQYSIIIIGIELYIITIIIIYPKQKKLYRCFNSLYSHCLEN